MERRTENAIPNRRVLANQVDVEVYKEREAYVDKYEELDWYPLDSYIIKIAGQDVLNNLRSEKMKMDFVVKELNQQIQYDNGIPGVIVRVHDDGRKRINAGTRSGMTKRQNYEDQNGDAEAVEHTFQSFNKASHQQFSQASSMQSVAREYAWAQEEDPVQSMMVSGFDRYMIYDIFIYDMT